MRAIGLGRGSRIPYEKGPPGQAEAKGQTWSPVGIGMCGGLAQGPFNWGGPRKPERALAVNSVHK